MKPFISVLISISLYNILGAQKIDSQELKCLVCQESVNELDKSVKSLDPSQLVDVGGYRLDAEGNYKHKSVSQQKSELKLSEIIEGVCERMEDYVRARRKDDGTLLLIRLMTEDGKMNPQMSDFDIVQDEDLNKSLKYYCEELMEEYEENIIKLYQGDEENPQDKVCVELTHYCAKPRAKVEL